MIKSANLRGGRLYLAFLGLLTLVTGEVRGDELWNNLPAQIEKRPAALDEFLKKHKISDTDGDGLALIHWLARAGKTELIRLAVRKGADGNQTTANKGRMHPLEMAAAQGWPDTVQVLLELGAKVKDGSGERSMRLASSQEGDRGARTVAVLAKAGVSVNGEPLWNAILNKEYTGVKALLVNGADVNQRNPKVHDMTMLAWAIGCGDVRIVRLILSYHPDLNAKMKYPVAFDGPFQPPPTERTALMTAAEKGWLQMVKLLVEAGADQTIRDQAGDTALDLARQWGRVDVLAYLQQVEEKRRSAAAEGSDPARSAR